jgi:hypothetical protein
MCLRTIHARVRLLLDDNVDDGDDDDRTRSTKRVQDQRFQSQASRASSFGMSTFSDTIQTSSPIQATCLTRYAAETQNDTRERGRECE